MYQYMRDESEEYDRIEEFTRVELERDNAVLMYRNKEAYIENIKLKEELHLTRKRYEEACEETERLNNELEHITYQQAYEESTATVEDSISISEDSLIREQEFHDRIQKIKGELAQAESSTRTGNVADILHPGIVNLPEDTIPQQSTTPNASEEFAE